MYYGVLPAFNVHTNIPELALYILRKSSRTKYDPWLLATEMAISSIVRIPSRYAKTAQTFLSDNSMDLTHLSELNSSTGTLELENGADKKEQKILQG